MLSTCEDAIENFFATSYNTVTLRDSHLILKMGHVRER